MNRTIDFLMNGKLDYEFRTTLVPGLVGKPEITSIAKRIKGARKFALQQFVPDNARSEAFRKKKPYTLPQLQELAAIVRPQVKELVIRGKAGQRGESNTKAAVQPRVRGSRTGLCFEVS